MSLKLLEPTLIGFDKSIPVKNRIALAPLTRGRSGFSQVPNDANAEYYAQRSTAGLVITEATIISKGGMGWAGAAAIYGKDHVAGWKKVVQKVHEANGILFLQLWHMGRVASSCFHGLQPVAPSALKAEGRVTGYDGEKHSYELPHALTVDEIKAVQQEYLVAALNAKEAGLDGIEFHCANGYLMDEFLQSCSNIRTDEYGGSFENRFRMIAEVLELLLSVFPSNRIGVRISPNGSFGSMGSADNPQAFSYYLERFAAMNLAYIHIMDGLAFGFHNLSPPFTLADTRHIYKGTIIGNCGYDKESAEAAVQSGNADMIAFGRPYIANPDLPDRFAKNVPLAEAGHEIFWDYPGFPFGNPRIGYTDFPRHDEAVFQGECMCGLVKLEVHGDTSQQVYCHCNSCRSHAAASFVEGVLLTRSQVRVLSGREQLGVYRHTPSTHRSFCKVCGTHLSIEVPDLNLLSVFVHVLKDFVFKPTCHLNYSEKMLAMKDGLPKFSGMPGSVLLDE